MWVKFKIVQDLTKLKSQLANKLEKFHLIKRQFEKDINRLEVYINLVKITNLKQAINILKEYNLTHDQTKNILRACTQGIFFENFEFAANEYRKDDKHVTSGQNSVYIHVYKKTDNWVYANTHAFDMYTVATFQIIDPETYDPRAEKELIQSSNFIDWDENKSYLEIVEIKK
jgi:hypothetical protein